MSQVQGSEATYAEVSEPPVVREKFDLKENECYGTLKVALQKKEANKGIALVVTIMLVVVLTFVVAATSIAFALEISNLKSEIVSAKHNHNLFQQLFQEIHNATWQINVSLHQYAESQVESIQANLLDQLSSIIRREDLVHVGGAYYRWGSSSCRSGATRVYAGRTGVSASEQRGSGGNYLCMPNDPEYTLASRSGVQGYGYVYGTEYEDPLVSGRQDHNVPCAVCYIPTKHAVIMIPAKTSCPSGWTREYYGYLMAEHINHPRSTYECIDRSMESIPGSQDHIDSGHFYHVEAHCNGMACPPYDNQKELNCVVCSK